MESANNTGKEITKELKFIIMRNGIEISLEGEKLKNFENYLSINQGSQFIRLEGRVINTADLVGVFFPKDLEELSYRKKGKWKCEYGRWHNRNETCDCGRLASYKNFSKK